MPHTHKFRKSAFQTLALSIPALLIVCSAVVGLDGTAHFVIQCPVQIAVAFACMAAFIWFSARLVAFYCARHFLIMGCYFVVVFLVGAVSGSVTSMLLLREFSIEDYLVKPVYWLCLFGLAPAFVLGVIGAAILGRSLRHEDAG